MTAAERQLHAIASSFFGLPAKVASVPTAHVVPCWACGGEGYVGLVDDRESRCCMCAGKGRVCVDGEL